MQQGDFPPPEKYPQKVHHNRHAARFARSVHEGVPERPQGISTEFEQLDAKGYPYDGKAHQQAYKIIDQGYYETSDHEPD
jgi:hypothetical protein